MSNLSTKIHSFKHKFHEWNANRPHLPDVHEHSKFRRFASILTHVGFFAKAILYGSMSMLYFFNYLVLFSVNSLEGVVAMLAATSEENYTAEGPEAVIQDLRTTFGLVITIALTAGIFIEYLLIF